MNKTLLISVVIILLMIGGYFILRGGYQTPTPVPSAPTPPVLQGEVTPTEGGVVAPTPTPSVREFRVVGNEFSFSPSSISVSAGERVKIIFKNEGKAPHNLVIQGLNIKTRTIGGGQTDTIEFTAPSSGTYTFYCSIPGHRSAGMEGKLEVK
jgi:plastocyanin